MKRLSVRILPATTAILLSASCTVGPRYQKPEIKTPGAYRETATKTTLSTPAPGQEAVEQWWTTFHDAELDALIQRATHNNTDLKISASRVRLARAQRAALGAALYPSIDVGAGYNRGHGSSNVALPFGNASNGSGGATSTATPAAQARMAADANPSGSSAANGGGGSIPTPNGLGEPTGPQSPFGEGGLPGVTTSLYQVGFDATWELDLFGASRQAVSSANAQLEAAEEERRTVLVSLLGEVAQTYIQLRSTQRRLEIAQANLVAQRQVLEIIRAKNQVGFETELSVQRQAQQVSTTEAAIPSQ